MGNIKQNPIVHYFKQIKVGQFRTTRHYELVKVENGTPQLSQLINISKDRGCAQSKPSYWLKTRLATKWSKAETGLFKTAINGLTYSGDLRDKKHLVLFQFSKGANTLTVFVYLNYFPFDKRLHPSTVARKIKLIPHFRKLN